MLLICRVEQGKVYNNILADGARKYEEKKEKTVTMKQKEQFIVPSTDYKPKVHTVKKPVHMQSQPWMVGLNKLPDWWCN